jgi:hypothetical protein
LDYGEREGKEFYSKFWGGGLRAFLGKKHGGGGGGGGGGNLPRGLETLIYEGDKLERIKKYIYWMDICPPLHTPSYPNKGDVLEK